MALARVFGFKVGVIVTALAFLLVVCAQLLGSWFGKNVSVDAGLILCATGTITGIVGFAVGRLPKK